MSPEQWNDDANKEKRNAAAREFKKLDSPKYLEYVKQTWNRLDEKFDDEFQYGEQNFRFTMSYILILFAQFAGLAVGLCTTIPGGGMFL